MQLLGFCLLFPVSLNVAVVLQKPALDVRLVAFGFETLSIQAQTFSLSWL